MKTKRAKPTPIAEIRRALADYIWSEGCGCCQNCERHREAAARLGRLLRVPKYPDGSGYHFARFASTQRKTNAD